VGRWPISSLPVDRTNPFTKGEDQMAKGTAGDKWVMGILGSIIVTVVSKLVYDWLQEQRRI
jgi:hypothetical protein